jgi:hypothetical protein
MTEGSGVFTTGDYYGDCGSREDGGLRRSGSVHGVGGSARNIAGGRPVGGDDGGAARQCDERKSGRIVTVFRQTMV